MYKNANGFSLMEALITVLVLGIGLLGLGQLQARLWAGAGDLHTLENAYLLAENLLEINPLTWLPATERQNLAQQFEPVISAILDQSSLPLPNTPLLITEVSAHWNRPSGVHSLSLIMTVNTGLGTEDTRWLLPGH